MVIKSKVSLLEVRNSTINIVEIREHAPTKLDIREVVRGFDFPVIQMEGPMIVRNPKYELKAQAYDKFHKCSFDCDPTYDEIIGGG